VDSLLAVRQLKEKGVEIYFQKENIYTLDAKGELLITIMSSLAQEEARSISENVTWGQRKRMADGKVSMAYKHFLGYEKGPDGTPQVVEEQAKTVRRIYALFLEGKSLREICAILTGEGIPTPGGKTVWQGTTVKSILRQEKYTGNAILQKGYTVDFLNKVSKPNQGEVPQYYVENSHPAIISQETYDLAQAELEALVKQNASTAQDQGTYARQYDALTAKYKAAKERLDVLLAEKQAQCVRREKAKRFCDTLKKTAGPLAGFDSRLWCTVVEDVTVYSMGRVVVRFSGGTEAEVAVDG